MNAVGVPVLITLLLAINSVPAHETPDCVRILVALSGRVDSANAKGGDVFHFHTLERSVAADHTVVPRGAPGYGFVTYAASAGAHGRVGQLILEARYIKLPDGTRYPVTVDAQAKSMARAGNVKTAPAVLGAIPVPIVGAAVGAFNYFIPGRNVKLDPGLKFVVTPVGDLSSPASACAR